MAESCRPAILPWSARFLVAHRVSGRTTGKPNLEAFELGVELRVGRRRELATQHRLERDLRVPGRRERVRRLLKALVDVHRVEWVK